MAIKKVVFFLFFISPGFIFSQNTQLKAHGIKFDFFSPLTGCLGLSYEQQAGPRTSIDIEGGYIGIKPHDINVFKSYNDYKGVYFSAGTRIYLIKDIGENDLKGTYLKPSLLINYFSYERQAFIYDRFTRFYNFTTLTGTDRSAAIMISGGQQFQLSGFLLLDIWMGIGYAGNWVDEHSDINSREEIYYLTNENNKLSYRQFVQSDIAVDYGVSVGILF